MRKKLTKRQIKIIANKARFLSMSGVVYQVNETSYWPDMGDEDAVISFRRLDVSEKMDYESMSISKISLQNATVEYGHVWSTWDLSSIEMAKEGTIKKRFEARPFEFFELSPIKL